MRISWLNEENMWQDFEAVTCLCPGSCIPKAPNKRPHSRWRLVQVSPVVFQLEWEKWTKRVRQREREKKNKAVPLGQSYSRSQVAVSRMNSSSTPPSQTCFEINPLPLVAPQEMTCERSCQLGIGQMGWCWAFAYYEFILDESEESLPMQFGRRLVHFHEAVQMWFLEFAFFFPSTPPPHPFFLYVWEWIVLVKLIL